MNKILKLCLIFLIAISSNAVAVSGNVLLDDSMDSLKNWKIKDNSTVKTSTVDGKSVANLYTNTVDPSKYSMRYKYRQELMLAWMKTGDATWKDYEVTTKIKAVSKDKDPTDSFKIYFRLDVESWERCYALVWNRGDDAIFLNRNNAVSLDGYGYCDMRYDLKGTFNPEAWNTFKIKAEGNHITVWLNDGKEPILDFTDTIEPVLQGGVGINARSISKSGLNVYCDSFKVEGTTQSLPDKTMTAVFQNPVVAYQDWFETGGKSWEKSIYSFSENASYAIEAEESNHFMKLSAIKTAGTQYIPAGYGRARIIDGNSGWSDYTLDFTAKSNGGGFGVLTRYIADNLYYGVRFYEDTGGRVELIKKEGNTEIVLAKKEQLGLNLKEWNSFRIRVKGEYFGVFAGDTMKEVLIFKDSNTSLLTGKIGLDLTTNSDRQVSAFYDEVTVYTNEENVILSPITPAKPKKAEKYETVQMENIYVDVNGVNGDGTKEKPFKTIEDAQQKVRNINQTEDVCINIKGGTYNLEKPLRLTEQDSGKNGHRVIYRSYDGRAVLSGGVEVKNWERAEQSGIWKAKVNGADELGFEQFYVDEQAKLRAGMWLTGHVFEFYKDTQSSNKMDGFCFNKNTVPIFKDPKEIKISTDTAWRSFTLPVENILEDPENAQQYRFQMRQPIFAESYAWQQQTGADLRAPIPKIRISGAFEMLDEPGEWYYDRKNKEIYYYAENGEDLDQLKCYVPKLDHVLEIEGTSLEQKVENIVFENIDFRHTNWIEQLENGMINEQASVVQNVVPENRTKYNIDDYPMGFTKMAENGVYLNNVNNIRLERNTFKCFGAGGIYMENGISNVVISGNVMENIAYAGITIGAWGALDEPKIPVSPFMKYTSAYNDKPGECAPVNVMVQNNIINFTGTVYSTGTGVQSMYAKDIYIAHNEITNVGWAPVAIGWGWCSPIFPNLQNVVVNNNLIKNFNANHNLHDVGGIYSLGAIPGALIAENYIENDFGSSLAALYHDEGSSFITTRNNVMTNVQGGINIRMDYFHDNVSINNYADVDNNTCVGYESAIVNQHYVPDKNWPIGAKEVIKNAGIEQEYQDIHSLMDKNSKIMEHLNQTVVYFDGKSDTITYRDHLKIDENPNKTAKIANGTLYLPPEELEKVTYKRNNNYFGLTSVFKPETETLVIAYNEGSKLITVEMKENAQTWKVDGNTVTVETPMIRQCAGVLVPVKQLYEILGVDKKVTISNDGKTAFIYSKGFDINTQDYEALYNYVSQKFQL